MRKILTNVTGVVFLSWLLGTMAVRQYYTRYRPESPQPELRQTVAIPLNYGKTVYVTLGESRMLYFTDLWFGIPLVILCIYAAARLRKSKPKIEA